MFGKLLVGQYFKFHQSLILPCKKTVPQLSQRNVYNYKVLYTYCFSYFKQYLICFFNLQMVVQFSDNCVDCENVRGIKRKDMEHFVQRFSMLSKDEIAVEMMVTSQDILNMLAHMVPCVGCRRRLVFGFNSVYVGKSLIKVEHKKKI